MPGIVGLISKMPSARAGQELLRMVQSIAHEPSYETGTWADEALGIYIGWAARQGSFSAGMPLLSERGDVVLVFSGEEFSEPGVSCDLKKKGHQLECDGPSYLAHLYEEEAGFPRSLNGIFHGLVVDRARGTAMLFNDRYGMHRLYYHEGKEAFYFAVEAKAILAARPELRSADFQSLGEFIACGCVLNNRTFFQGIQVLPPASAWLARQGEIERKDSYFNPQEWEDQAPLDRESYYQQIREVFSRNLPRYFSGREKIGMSLTGGLDTRMIMAWHRAAPGDLPCYSFGGMYRDCQDVVLARRVAGMCRQPYEVIPVGKDFLSRFAHYAERTIYLTDGCANVSRAADLYANERAAAIAPVRMTGNYGSEILRRLPAFKPVDPAPGLFRPEFVAHVQQAKATYSSLLGRHVLSFIAFRQTPWHHHSLFSLEKTQLSLRSPYLDNDLVRTAFRAPGAAVANTDIFADDSDCVRLIEDGNPALRRLRTDRGLAGPPGRFSSAMARGWLEFTFKAEYAYDYGMPQWVAGIDHAFSRLHLERLFLGRHKFNHFRVWYRDALSAYIREMLLDPRTLARPYLESANLQSIVEGHLKGNRNYTSEIHTVLTLELLHRVFLDPR